jgi:hypothetical protein
VVTSSTPPSKPSSVAKRCLKETRVRAVAPTAGATIRSSLLAEASLASLKKEWLALEASGSMTCIQVVSARPRPWIPPLALLKVQPGSGVGSRSSAKEPKQSARETVTVAVSLPPLPSLIV